MKCIMTDDQQPAPIVPGMKERQYGHALPQNLKIGEKGEFGWTPPLSRTCAGSTARP
jgi:hypothetical protein